MPGGSKKAKRGDVIDAEVIDEVSGSEKQGLKLDDWFTDDRTKVLLGVLLYQWWKGRKGRR